MRPDGNPAVELEHDQFTLNPKTIVIPAYAAIGFTQRERYSYAYQNTELIPYSVIPANAAIVCTYLFWSTIHAKILRHHDGRKQYLQRLSPSPVLRSRRRSGMGEGARRAGEGSLPQLLASAIVPTKGPSSGLRPPSPILLRCRYAGRAKAIILNSLALYRPRKRGRRRRKMCESDSGERRDDGKNEFIVLVGV